MSLAGELSSSSLFVETAVRPLARCVAMRARAIGVRLRPLLVSAQYSNAVLVLTRSTKEEGVSEESGRKCPCAFRPSSSSGASFESIRNPSADAVPALANSIPSKQEWYEPYKNCVCHARRGSVVFVKV